MTNTPRLILIEPTAKQKQRRLAEGLSSKGTTNSYCLNLSDIKQKLNEIRSHSVEQMVELTERFKQSIGQYKNAHLLLANETEEAIAHIVKITSNDQTIFTGVSSTINELRPGLEKRCYNLIDSYSEQFMGKDEDSKTVNYAWQLPSTFDQSAWDTFDYGNNTDSIGNIKDFVALLGVNAASAEDGTLFFLQHSSNLGHLLRHAKQLIVVIGIEKIVANSEEALFQTKCSGTFGMESKVLDLKIGKKDQRILSSFLEMPDIPDGHQEVHIILLDNGRTSIGKGKYKELLKCIGCRACSKQCPGYHNLTSFGYFPREYLWLFLIGHNPSLELCTYCSQCELECPIDINLAKLISIAKSEYSPEIARSFTTLALLNLTMLAPLMSFIAPLINCVIRIRLLRILIEMTIGIDRRRNTPIFYYHTFERWFTQKVNKEEK